MQRPPLDLATPEELRRLARRAIAAVHLHFQGSSLVDDEEEERQNERFQTALAALRYCAAMAVHLGATSLLDVLVEALLAFPELHLVVEDDDVHGLAGAVGRLLERGAQVTPEVSRLSASEDPRLRWHVARGLAPVGPEAIAVLEGLAADANADVRAEARGKLRERGEVPWWRGKLSRDPLPALSPEERARHAEALARISAILDEPSEKQDGLRAELVELAGTLPDAVMIDLGATLLRGIEGGWEAEAPLATRLASRPGSEEAIFGLLRVWTDADLSYHGVLLMKAALGALAGPRRGEVCWALARFALGASDEARDARRSAEMMAAEIAGEAWPPGEDTEPLLDALLLVEPLAGSWHDRIASALSRALRHPPAAPERMIQRAVEARLSGFPGRSAAFGAALQALLEAAPGQVLRATALAARDSDELDTVRWGVGQLLGQAWDAALDPPRPELVEALCGVPRMRAALLTLHPQHRMAIAPLRRALRAGQLTYHEALTTVRAVGAIYGGLDTSGLYESARPGAPERRRAEAEDERRQLREDLAPFLGPPELRGPPTDEEWSTLRALRRASSEHERYAALLNLCVPEGPTWHPEDRALVDEGLAAARAGKAEAVSLVAEALTIKPQPGDLAILDELIALAADDDEYGPRQCKLVVARALGAAAPPPAPAPALAEARAWMDEPEG
jgi:hypothetical protein